MTEAQKVKRNFRAKKAWKEKKKDERKRAGGKDEITLFPLRSGWQLHHMNMDERKYQDMTQPFLCVNKMTHDFLHWLYVYYKKDKNVLERIRGALDTMAELDGCLLPC